MRDRKKRTKRRTKNSPPQEGLRPDIRMKGGIRFDATVNGFVAMVHTWDDVQRHGPPEEWRSPESFPTEDTAMQYYKTSIRPAVEQMMTERACGHSDRTILPHRLEDSSVARADSSPPEYLVWGAQCDSPNPVARARPGHLLIGFGKVPLNCGLGGCEAARKHQNLFNGRVRCSVGQGRRATMSGSGS